jgi:hypothetical protein
MGAEEPSNAATAVPVLALGATSASRVLCSYRGQLRVTVVAKATFALTPEREMTPVAPAEIVVDSIHLDGKPMKSVRACSDLAPHLERAEVLFVGRAYAPGAGLIRYPVRLAVASHGAMLVDKRLEVTGDRPKLPGGGRGDPRPFQSMPLIYERAYGGIGCVDNPLGPGLEEGSAPPNVTYPDPRLAKQPASFAPIAPSWPARKQLLKGLGRKVLDAPIVALPDDFDLAYFQSAPADQRTARLAGREWILLEGLHAKHARLRTQLPAMRAGALVYGPGWPRQPFELLPDTLLIDGDAERCSVVFRASFPVREDALASICVAAGVHLAGEPPIAWPDALSPSEVAPPKAPKQGGAPAPRTWSSTLTFDDDLPAADIVLPFAVSDDDPMSRRAHAEIPGAPWAKAAIAATPLARAAIAPVDVPTDVTLPPRFSDASPSVPPPAPPSAPPPPPAPKAGSPWAPEGAPAPAPPPKQQKLGQKVDVLSKLYGAGRKR